MALTVGLSPGALVSGDGAMVPPGAVGGRGGVVTWFHGHMVSFRLCPTLVVPGSPKGFWTENVLELVMSKRPLTHCHFAHSRSTLAWSRKKSGSLAAVGILEMNPAKLTWAVPCGLPSMVRNGQYRSPGPPSVSVSASVKTAPPGPVAASVRVLKNGRLTTPGAPSVAQNCNGLAALNCTLAVVGSATPMKARLNRLGAGRSNRQ